MTSAAESTRFRELPADRPAAELEEEMLERWRAEDLFARVQHAREGAPEWVFFEGPPTANGRPGIHHVAARTIKDLFCRFRVMTGCHVTRKAGWDTHGLAVEIEVEKELGISGKPQIEEVGVERFNALCRESVWRHREEFERLSERIGYWLDYANPYVTYANDYVESVWWALATLFERDLLYRGFKILPYCARCGTALSSHEVAQGYRDATDPSVFVALELAAEDAAKVGGEGARLLVWTTTPWTLVSNTALAVNPAIDYVVVRRREGDARPLILADARARAVLGEDYTDRWEIVRRLTGGELVGLRYRRPLDWVPYPADGAHEVVLGEEFVSAADGTGIVHLSPAFGADDFAAGQRNGLAFVRPVNARGEFDAGIPLVGGRFVKDADPLIIEELRRRGVLFRSGTIVHAYPFCWRCDTPLLYYARESWFVRTTAFRDRMLARNARVHWYPPETGAGRFGEWLTNNVDWALSRDRYWGTPLPIWVCDADDTHREAIGSYAQLAARWGQPLPETFDPHKPFIDAYTWPCARCGGTMRRTPEVADAWFDSGSMPFAQWHYPFEGQEDTARHFPADFIAEGVDQTRGWFYSLLAIATGLGDALPNNAPDAASPYRNVVVNDMILDAAGQKMSKHRGNVVDPWAVAARHGADAVRLYFLASSQVWLPKLFDEEAIRDVAGRVLLTLRNVYTGMFARYANFGWALSDADPAPEARPAVDRWILSRLAAVETQAHDALVAFDATQAVRAVMDFVVDDVSNWYVRLNRSRFYEVDGLDNRAAFATLYEVLVVTCRLLAPFCPFVTDWIHRELTGESVHLASYVREGARGTGGARRDPALEGAMTDIRTLATLARAAREEAGVKVRQPLSRLVCVVPNYKAPAVQPLVPLLAAELNVKEVEFVSDGDALVQLEARPNYRALGKRFGKRTPLVAAAVAALDGAAVAALQRGEPVAVSVEGESHVLQPDDVSVLRRASGALVVQESGGYVAALDPEITPELRREGVARELVSRVQRLRKDAGFEVSDRIRLHVGGDAAVEEAAAAHREYVAAEVLAVEMSVGGQAAGDHDALQTVDLDGLTARIALTRVR
ncbi:MAG TPA: isoleucine--tRNA ligase [Gemmatimonadaceae bacterium]|nr:isoleucine--tRNA ligase [Gemmatimonadaceae bacterium]